MRCRECGKENGMTANYCRFCGNAFSEDERQAAYDATVFGFLDKLESVKGWLDLSKITGNRTVRILFLAVLLCLTVFNVARNGSHLAIRNGDGYTVAYNGERQEYYVLTDEDTVCLCAYLPQKTDAITVTCIVEGEISFARTGAPDDQFVLERMDNGYYLMRADYSDGTQEDVVFFVCKEDAT